MTNLRDIYFPLCLQWSREDWHKYDEYYKNEGLSIVEREKKKDILLFKGAEEYFSKIKHYLALEKTYGEKD